MPAATAPLGVRFQRRIFRACGGAANDCVCRLAWYREYTMRIPSCWFWADPPYGVAGCGDKFLYRPSAAYIEKKDKPVYCFVINAVDLETGLDHDLTLSVPYRGDFPMPKVGYAAMPEWMHAEQPHLLSIRRLSVDGDMLTIVMGHPGKDADDVSLEF